MMLMFPLFLPLMAAACAVPLVGVLVVARWLSHRGHRSEQPLAGPGSAPQPDLWLRTQRERLTTTSAAADALAQRDLADAQREVRALREQLAWQTELLARPAPERVRPPTGTVT